MQRKNGFTPIIVLIVTLLVAGGIYLGLMRVKQNQNINPVYSPSPIDTSNWNTYINREFGFSFKYPLDFDYFQELPLRVADLREGELSTILEIASKRDDFFLKISVSRTNSTPQEWVEGHNCPLTKDKKISCSIRGGSIVGSLQYQQIPEDGLLVSGGSTFVSTYVRNQGYLFEFFSTKSSSNTSFVDENELRMQNQILSTFKFN